MNGTKGILGFKEKLNLKLPHDHFIGYKNDACLRFRCYFRIMLKIFCQFYRKEKLVWNVNLGLNDIV